MIFLCVFNLRFNTNKLYMIIISFKLIHSWCHFTRLLNPLIWLFLVYSDDNFSLIASPLPLDPVIFMWQSVVVSVLFYSWQFFILLSSLPTVGITVLSAILNCTNKSKRARLYLQNVMNLEFHCHISETQLNLWFPKSIIVLYHYINLVINYLKAKKIVL